MTDMPVRVGIVVGHPLSGAAAAALALDIYRTMKAEGKLVEVDVLERPPEPDLVLIGSGCLDIERLKFPTWQDVYKPKIAFFCENAQSRYQEKIRWQYRPNKHRTPHVRPEDSRTARRCNERFKANLFNQRTRDRILGEFRSCLSEVKRDSGVSHLLRDILS